MATYIVFARLILVNLLHKLLTFKPTMLVVNGVIDMKVMKKEHITVPHLSAELRMAGYSSLDDIKDAKAFLHSTSYCYLWCNMPIAICIKYLKTILWGIHSEHCNYLHRKYQNKQHTVRGFVYHRGTYHKLSHQ